MSDPKRRPRGNFSVCGDKYWVSWGPRAPRPDTRTGFSVLMRTEPENPESDFYSAGGNEPDAVPHPDHPPLTFDQALEVIDGLCAALAEYTQVWPRKD